MRLLRPASEAEVIAEFLKCEFYDPIYDRDRDRFSRLVTNSDSRDPREDALRHALLFRKRGHMWRELPRGTDWWLAELDERDIPQIRIFPRAHWVRIGRGDFRLTNILRRVEQGDDADPAIQKIRAIQQAQQDPTNVSGAVLMIGIDAAHPLVVLEGNHRVTAAALDRAANPFANPFQNLRFYCGFSPQMDECCWYRTNLFTLWRYLKNRVRNLRDRSESEIAQATLMLLLSRPQEVPR